jgi:hypothetical protein
VSPLAAELSVRQTQRRYRGAEMKVLLVFAALRVACRPEQQSRTESSAALPRSRLIACENASIEASLGERAGEQRVAGTDGGRAGHENGGPGS